MSRRRGGADAGSPEVLLEFLFQDRQEKQRRNQYHYVHPDVRVELGFGGILDCLVFSDRAVSFPLSLFRLFGFQRQCHFSSVFLEAVWLSFSHSAILVHLGFFSRLFGFQRQCHSSSSSFLVHRSSVIVLTPVSAEPAVSE